MDPKKSSLTVIIGPMFSGKTSYLLGVYNAISSINNRVVAINHTIDDRYTQGYMCTHDDKKVKCSSVTDLRDFCNKNIDNYDVFLINEGQFFENLYETVLNLVDKHNKQVYVCGLDGDFKRNKMGEILDLIPISDKVVKLKSRCSICGEDAIFTCRMVSKNDQVLVGGSDMYQPLCRKCYLLKNG